MNEYMRLIAASLLAAACGGDVPHLIVRDTGEDLGPLVDYSTRQSYWAGSIVQWAWTSWDWVLYYSGPGCTGPAWFARDSVSLPQAIPDPSTGFLLQISGARGAAVVASQRLFWSGMVSCADFAPEERSRMREAVQTDIPGRAYAYEELGVELR